MNYREQYEMLNLDIDYLLDTYNHNLKNGNNDENEKVLDDLRKLNEDYLLIKLNLNANAEIDYESVFAFLKTNTFKDISDEEIANHAKTLCRTFEEDYLRYIMSLLGSTAYNSYAQLKDELSKSRTSL